MQPKQDIRTPALYRISCNHKVSLARRRHIQCFVPCGLHCILRSRKLALVQVLLKAAGLDKRLEAHLPQQVQATR